MKHLFLTAFMAVFGVYALGLVGIIEMSSTQNDKTTAQKEESHQVLTFTERVALNQHTQKSAHKNGYTLKAMR